MFIGCPISAAFFSAAAITLRASLSVTTIDPPSRTLVEIGHICGLHLIRMRAALQVKLVPARGAGRFLDSAPTETL
jgi:hypothetical protein